MSSLFWKAGGSSTRFSEKYDIAIIGGGLVGLSVAYWLTELKPGLKIILFERETIGSGASGKNAGFLTKGSASFYKGLTQKFGEDHAREIQDFAAKSLELTLTHLFHGQSSQVCEETSSMTLFKSEQCFLTWKDNDQFNPESMGFVWRQKDVLTPFLKDHYFGGYESSPEYKINPFVLIHSLKEKVEKRGVVLKEGLAAYELIPEGVRTDDAVIQADKVILALNGYSSQFHPQLEKIIAPKRAQMLAVELSSPLNCPHLYYDPSERVYWRLFQDNILLIGGKRLLDEKGEVGEFEKVSPIIQQGLENYLQNNLRLTYSPLRRWSGIMGFTDDELPILTKGEAPVETYIVAGFSGHGIGLGFHSGLECAQLALHQKKQSLFSVLRDKKIIL